MSGFDPDKYLSDNALNPSKDFNPDDYLAKVAPASMGQSVARGLEQGATLGFFDEMQGGAEAIGQALGIKGLGGPMRDLELQSPNLFDGDKFSEAYKKRRDQWRDDTKHAEKSNPTAYTASNIGGGLATSIIPIGSAASLGKAAATGLGIGALSGAGASEADNVKDFAIDTGIGGALGGVLGAGGYGATRAALTGAEKARLYLANKLKDVGETAAFKSSGAMLKDFRNANDRGKVSEYGRYILDDLGLKIGDKVDDVAAKATEKNKAAGMALDDVYRTANEKFKEKMQTIGFDPKRDKEAILSAAKDELGDAVGGSAALNKLSTYLDDLSQKYGDGAMSPRRTNEIKTAMDDVINYSRNPLTKEPNNEKVFSAARGAMSKKVDDSMASLGGDDLLMQLKSANKNYGTSKQIERIAKDKVSREQANRIFGLTDTIAASGGLGAGAALAGGPGAIAMAAGAGLANKAARTYGPATLAVSADRVSKMMLKSKPMQDLAQKNPAAFKAMVIDMTSRLQERGGLPKAAQQPNELDRDSSTPAQERVSEDEAKRQFLDGN